MNKNLFKNIHGRIDAPAKENDDRI